MENSPAGAAAGAAGTAGVAAGAAGAAGAPTSDDGREDGALVLAGRAAIGAAPRRAAAAAYEIVGAGVAGAAGPSGFSAGIGRSGSSLTAMVKGLLIRDSSCTVR